MTLALARDKLQYNEDQLAALSKQIRLGDMTPVMEVYEEDIRKPLRSAIGGTLLRNVFIQVQKAKVSVLIGLICSWLTFARLILTKL